MSGADTPGRGALKNVALSSVRTDPGLGLVILVIARPVQTSMPGSGDHARPQRPLSDTHPSLPEDRPPYCGP